MSVQKFPLRTALFVSVALNLIVVGAAIGLAISGAHLHRPGAPPGFGLQPRAFMGALPPQKAAEIRQRLAAAWRDSTVERDGVRAARLALLRAVEQDTLDEAAVRAALADLRAAEEKLAAKNQDAVIGVLQDLSPPERAAALSGLLRAGALGAGRDGLGRNPPPPGAPAP